MTAPVDQAVEAAAKLIYETWKDIPEYRLWQNGGNSLKQDEARRIARQVIELASQQEVAAPVGPLSDVDFDELWLLFSRYEAQFNKSDSDEALAAKRANIDNWLAKLAAARVPVASPAEPIKATEAMVQTYLTANDDYWTRTDQMPDKNPSKWRQGTPKEATRESLNAVFALLAAPPVGAGGAGVMDARPDSFHSDSGECGRVQRVELSGDELALFQQTLEDFADCGETETDYEVLVNWAQRGLLECTNFRPTAAAHRMLAPGASTNQEGNAT